MGPHALNFSWLVKLRWAAIAGQLVTIAGVHAVMRIPLPLAPLLAIVGIEIVTNVACALWVRRGGPDDEWPAATVMALDVVVLTGLLYFTGGPFNPFFFLYLVDIALAAVILRPRWTWALVALSLVGSALLFIDHRALNLPPLAHDDHMRLHLQGMWVAFGVAAAFIVSFLMRVVRALSIREHELQATHAQKERLRSLATLAGGAAHELSTPMSTIAVVARELERKFEHTEGIAEDVKLIRTQVDRCREILAQLAARAGTGVGDGAVAISVRRLLDEAVRDLAERPAVRIAPDDTLATEVVVPPRALAQAVRGLIKNAQDASAPDSEVVVRAQLREGNLEIAVLDRGAGMSPSVAVRAGEPFFTTKPPGQGMGLGLFLARSVMEQLGGDLRLHSSEGEGTRATLIVPAAPATNDRMAAR